MAATVPEDADRLFGEYVNAGNLEGVVGLYEPGATLVMPDGNVSGSDNIRSALAAFIGAQLQLQMKVTKVVRSGADIAVLYNDWSGTANGPDGQPAPMSGKALEIVRRQPDGTWRFVVDDPYARG